ncbi:MAG: hypothetical protein WCJ33_05805, partial [Pseudomonadota bacterium]
LAPELICYAHQMLAEDLSWKQKREYYAQSGVWQETKNAYEHIIAAHPKGSVWLLNYAIDLYDAGYNNETADFLNRAAETDPYYSRTFYEAGKIYSKSTTTYYMAEKSYLRYLELVPNNAEVYGRLANIKYGQSKYNEAIEFSNKAIKIDSNIPEFFADRCRAEIKIKQISEAAIDCNKAVKLCDDKCNYRGFIYLTRSDLYKSIGDDERSRMDYVKYISYKTIK